MPVAATSALAKVSEGSVKVQSIGFVPSSLVVAGGDDSGRYERVGRKKAEFPIAQGDCPLQASSEMLLLSHYMPICGLGSPLALG